MPDYITEGTPVHTAGAYYQTGRGGAGNYRRLEASAKSEVTGTFQPAQPTLTNPPPPPASGHFYGGRGGAGNIHRGSERAIFSFDEELERDRRYYTQQAPVFSVIGRGGAGNIVPRGAEGKSPQSSPRPSVEEPEFANRRTSISSEATASSSGSSIVEKGLKAGAEKVWDRLARYRTT